MLCGWHLASKILYFIVFLLTLEIVLSAVEPMGGWNPVQKKVVGKVPVGKFEKPTLKPTRVKKINHDGYWPHGYDQIQIESKQKKKLGVGVSVGYPVRYIRTGFELSTLVAVALVSALLGAMTYSLADSRGQRSVTSPFSFLNLVDQETVVRILSSIVHWYGKPENIPSASSTSSAFRNFYIANSTNIPAPSNYTGSARMAREAKTPSSGDVLQWYLAYKKDPIELKCVQKLICESLATSACAARSINSSFGSSVIAGIRYFFGGAGEVADLIRETVKNPEICKKDSLASICDANSTSKPTQQQGIHPAPNFNISSITPRVFHRSSKNITRVFFSV